MRSHPRYQLLCKMVLTAMSNFDQRYVQYKTDSETNPLLNSTMKNFQSPSDDHDVNE